MSKIIFFLALLALAKGEFPLPWERELHETPIIQSRDLATSDVGRNDDNVYRLPDTIYPLEYDIYIDLYFSERPDRPYSYDGRVSILIQAVKENVRQVVLHANVDDVSGISVLRPNGTTINIDSREIEIQYHFLKINLDETLEVGVNYTLSIEYSSTMNEGPMKRGIWRGWYIDDNGVERSYATTHFQPYNARQAFPCWDEPLFKAIFKLHLSRPSTYTQRYSNTDVETVDLISRNDGEGRAIDNFKPTLVMSTYLLTFLVSETFTVIAEDRSFNPPIRIIGRSNTVGMADHALDFAVQMTEFFDEYFGIPYSTLDPNLLNDHISSPDWASAGTENWGMVSYRELYLILDSRETLMSVEHYAATLVSHELAHKWFGNLITCFWWSNTWINEGFASYFGYIATHEKFPRYELHEHFNSRYLQGSLSFDSGASTVPMNHDVNAPAQVTGHFGTVSYSKGAAFLRMLTNMITAPTFRKACTYFLEDNEYKPTDQFDLYNAFARAIDEDGTLDEYQYFNFTDFYRVWVNEPGYPILYVDIDFDTGEMALSQERFFLNPATPPSRQVYPIPITYSRRDNATFNELKPIYMMTTDRIVLNKPQGEEWVIFNNLQHGHYRVNYNARNWELITEAILNDPESIHYLNRAQIVDDVFALMRSTRMTHSFGFNILRFLRNETNYHVWDPAISGYTWLRNRLKHLPEQQAEFDAFVLGYLEHVIETVGFETIPDETPTFTMTRQVILHFACMLGHTGCVEESRNRFIALRDNAAWVSPGIRRNVYLSGIREGGRQDFQFLLDRFHQSNFANDQLEILRALGAARNPELLTEYLQLTLTKMVRSHDKLNSFNYALLGNQENAYVVLQFVRSHIDDIREQYVEDSPANPVQSALSNLATYLTEPELVEYETWLQETQSDTAQFTGTLNAISSARININWGTNNVDEIIGAVRAGATRTVTSLAILLIMAAVTMLA